ncbi:MAG: FecR domain-containing protein [Polyangiales bacterium]
MITERSQDLRDATEPPWDEAADQRALAKVLAARRGEVAPARPRRVARWAVAAAALVAVSVAGGAWVRWQRANAPGGERASTVGIAGAGARLALPDGSEAMLSADGRVELEHAAAQSVRLRQQRGTVTYRVRRDPSRSFEVRAGTVTVSVRGTVFDVAMREGAVEVSVSEGRVLVEDDRTRVELTAGEHVSLRRRDEPTLISEDASALALDAASAPHEADAAVSGSELPRRTSVAPSVESVASLLDRVDEARSSGDNETAATLLRRLLGRELSSAQRASASFTLARVERARGQHRAAAEALAECVARSPNGPLAEDALAEQALAWERVGDRARAQRTAAEYVERYPQGAHLARLRHLGP